MNAVATPSSHPAFELKRCVSIESLGLEVQEYVHRVTGARHLHMATDADENVFMVALKTVPQDSTGVAHILEHTVLCGSEKYPVRDPFFMMLRRSLNTFMNAFTSSDWTAYPFATQNAKDFDNLLSVYLDAVFFSRLDPLDFAQEGHRIELESDEADAPLVYKGVVFNEMKGAMSSISSVLWDRLCFELFPTSTYHFNSGGDPEVIPDLSYEQLIAFYTGHYHPSNAILLTFGNLPVSQHHEAFERRALSRFEASSEEIEVALETPFDSPKKAVHHYALDDTNTSEKTHLIMGWKLGESTDLDAMLEAQLISSALMENSASPLMKWLETNDLGSAPSPLCGLEDSMREMVLCCGIEGSDKNRADEFEKNVLDVIRKTAEEGVSADRLEAILHQLELHQREVTGDGMPYGLNLMLRALGAATHNGDAVSALDLSPAVDRLRQKIRNPDYVSERLRSLLLDNPHRVTLIVAPDPNLDQQRKKDESAKLSKIRSGLDDADIDALRQLASDLEARQNQVDDANILPKVDVEDIPRDVSSSKVSAIPLSDGVRHYIGDAGTNGLVYQQIALGLPNLSSDQQAHLPLLCALATEVGISDASYLSVQDRQSAAVGSLSMTVSTRSSRDDVNHASGYLVVSSKALANRTTEQASLMMDTLTQASFTEGDRIRELVSQMRARRDQSINGAGHSLAMTAACAGMSPLARLYHQQGGLEGILRLRQLDDQLSGDAELLAFSRSLETLRDTLLSAPSANLLTVSDPRNVEKASQILREATSDLAAHSVDAWSLADTEVGNNQIWAANTQVNFCAKAYPTVASGHPDAPVLSVLAAYLRNGYLHRAIREQGGAYGGGASHDANVGAFRFFSYRDPRNLGTLADFDESISWLLDSSHSDLALEEAIFSVISSLDKPASPAGEVKKAFYDALFLRTSDQKKEYREGILSTTVADLQRVAERYLMDDRSCSVVLTDSKTASSDAVKALEWSLHDLS
jgi:Zn-dependent M16 (insulinase) family peptidase